MKTKDALIITGIMMLFLAGCIPSIHRLYHDDDLVFKPELIGRWQDDSKNVWEFSAGDNMGYSLMYYEGNNPIGSFSGNAPEEVDSSDFEAHLVRLGEYYFLDLFPGDNPQIKTTSLLTLTLLPVHIFAKVEFVGNKVVVKMFNPDWFDKLSAGEDFDLPFERTEDYLVLTASTDQLQQFVMKYAEDQDAFLEASVLHRLD